MKFYDEKIVREDLSTAGMKGAGTGRIERMPPFQQGRQTMLFHGTPSTGVPERGNQLSSFAMDRILSSSLTMESREIFGFSIVIFRKVFPSTLV